MLANPLLAECSVEDLNQRYRETYISYKGQGRYCRGFGVNDGGRKILSLSNAGFVSAYDAEEKTEVFEPLALDCERPPCRWYKSKRGYPVFVRYSIARQWQRGICKRNTLLFCSRADVPCTLSDVVSEMFNKENYDTRWRNILPLDGVVKEVKDKGFILLNPWLLAHRGNDNILFNYRGTGVGYWLEGKEIKLTKPQFKQELMETIIGATYNRRGDPNHARL